MQLHCSASADLRLGSGVGRKQKAKHPTLLLACFLIVRGHAPPNSQNAAETWDFSSDKLLTCAVELNGTVPHPSVNSKGTESSAPSPECKVHVFYLSFQDKGYSMCWVMCRGENAKIDGIFRR